MPYDRNVLRTAHRASNTERWKVRTFTNPNQRLAALAENVEVQTEDGRFIADFGQNMHGAVADAASIVMLHNTAEEILDTLQDALALVRCAQSAAVTLEATTRAGQGELWGVAQALKQAAQKVEAHWT